MIKKIFWLALGLFMANSVIAQKEVAVVKTDYKAKSYGRKESLTISNPVTNDLVLLVEDSKQTNLYLLDSNLNQKATVSTNRLDEKFANFVGYEIGEEDNYTIFFMDSYNKKLGTLNINFKKNSVEKKLINIIYNKEKYVTTISHEGKFYLVTVAKKSSEVTFYEYNYQGLKNKHAISFETMVYENNGFKKKVISLLTRRGIGGDGGIGEIDQNSPVSIESASSPIKLYQLKNKLLFTSDKQLEVTKAISINTQDFSSENVTFEMPKLPLKDEESVSFVEHNSFYKDEILYQVVVNSSQMKFVAKDYHTQKFLKEINLEKNDSITFKNGPIVQKGGGSYGTTRVRLLEKASKFLRKTASGNVGITSYTIDGLNQIKIGSYKEVQNGGGGAAYGAAFGAAGAIALVGFAAASASFNPVGSSYYGYRSSRSVHINCLFDKSFNHVKEAEVKENVFDVIEAYENTFVGNNDVSLTEPEDEIYQNNKFGKSNSSSISDEKRKAMEKFGIRKSTPKLKNIFYHNGNHFFGYLDSVDRQYHLVKF